MQTKLKTLRQNLFDQFNSQNGGTKPESYELYNYQLTESEFDAIINLIALADTVDKTVGN